MLVSFDDDLYHLPRKPRYQIPQRRSHGSRWHLGFGQRHRVRGRRGKPSCAWDESRDVVTLDHWGVPWTVPPNGWFILENHVKIIWGYTHILGNLQFAKSHLEVTKGSLFRALGLRVCDVSAQYHAWQVMKWRDGAKAGQERSRCPPSLLRKSCLHRLMDVNHW